MTVENNAKADYVFDYSSTKYRNVGNYYNFFNVPNVCPQINKCEIRERGCEKKYTGDKLYLSRNTQVQARTNYEEEYEETFCLQCSNSQ